MQPLLQWKSCKNYILWECACIHRYPACNAHAPFCQLWPVRLYSIFPHCLINGTSLIKYYLLTYFLTPWCRVLLEKLTGLQLVKKFLAYHGTRRFITALTSVRHPSLSWASPIQSIYLHPTSWRSILILSTHLRLGLPSGLLPSGSPSKTLHTPSPHPYAPHAQPISFFSILSPAQYWVRSTNHLAPRYAISSILPLKKNIIQHKMCVLVLFTTLYETFFILRRIERHMNKYSGCNPINLKIKIYRTIIFPVVCMGVKLGRWHCGRKGSWGCLRTWCWGEYFDLGGTR